MIEQGEVSVWVGRAGLPVRPEVKGQSQRDEMRFVEIVWGSRSWAMSMMYAWYVTVEILRVRWTYVHPRHHL